TCFRRKNIPDCLRPRSTCACLATRNIACLGLSSILRGRHDWDLKRKMPGWGSIPIWGGAFVRRRRTRQQNAPMCRRGRESRNTQGDSMKIHDLDLNSVNWEHGMLLTPDHFVRQERYFDSSLLWILRYATNSYGLVGGGPRLPEDEREPSVMIRLWWLNRGRRAYGSRSRNAVG